MQAAAGFVIVHIVFQAGRCKWTVTVSPAFFQVKQKLHGCFRI